MDLYLDQLIIRILLYLHWKILPYLCQQIFTRLVQCRIAREDCLDISTFIAFTEEAVFDPQEEIIEHITRQFDPGREAESDEEISTFIAFTAGC